MYAIYLVGMPGTAVEQYYTSVFMRDTFKDFEKISLVDYILENAKKNNVSFLEEWQKTDFLELYKDIQRRIDKAVEQNKNIVLDTHCVTVLSRSRFNIPEKYKKVAITFDTDSMQYHLNRDKDLYGTIYPANYSSILLSYSCPITAVENFEWTMESNALTNQKWVTFWENKVGTNE